MTTIDFYFDFISPYAYLGSVEVERIAARRGWSVRWQPMLLGITMFKVMGLKAVPDTPLKGAYALHDMARFARFLGVPLDPMAKLQFNPLAAARAFVWLQIAAPERAKPFAIAVYSAHWCDGRDMGEATAVADVAAGLGIGRTALLDAIASQPVKDRLRQSVDDSIARGVFGAPTFVVGQEIFWGADRLPQLERWIETGGW